MKHILTSFGRLRWKLTLSYTLVTVAALLAAEVLALAVTVGFVGSDLLLRTITQVMMDQIAPPLSPYLAQTPPDVEGLHRQLDTLFSERGALLSVSNRQEARARVTVASGDTVLVLDAGGRLWGAKPAPPDAAQLGQPFDAGSIPGLETILPNALAGERDASLLYASLPGNRLVVAVPIRGEGEQVVGVLVFVTTLSLSHLDNMQGILSLFGISLVAFTLVAGLVGTVFGFLTARGLSRRLRRLAGAADAWSHGDFSATVGDRSGDEVGQLARHLNRMAEQLQNLLHTRQELAVSEERNRLARDLHDSVKQQVFAAAMQLGAARALIADNPEQAQVHLAEAERLTHQTQQELMALIQKLRPLALQDRGLASALQGYVADWSRQTGIVAGASVQGDGPLPIAVEQALFRVAQEALANVARHSGATTAEIRLAWEGDAVTLTIADNGQGFDVAAADGTGLGLRSMRERVEALGGSLRVESKAGAGTRVVVKCPARM
ncbi:MAG: HAMP domain-containing protein [Anaerolineae bacterium]|nr:HAMP domain-containing protein [Anaerolineae bacterium]